MLSMIMRGSSTRFLSCIGYIGPLLEKLSDLHNFTIESQVQFHAPLAFEPRHLEHEGQNVHGLTHEDLTVFINSAEWTLCMYRTWSRGVNSTYIFATSFKRIQ